MRQKLWWNCLVVAGCVAAVSSWKTVPVHGASVKAAHDAWDPKTAAAYLDGREVWWQGWAPAQMDHGTICISCHTVVPYAMARPGLRRMMSEREVAAPEKIMVENVEARVDRWADMTPFYSDAANGPGKTAESHSTEAVMNAVILGSYDARQGWLRPITRKAFEAAWALQDAGGGWKWQDFHLAPWECVDSAYQGAALFGVMVGSAPEGYAEEVATREHVERLRVYLREHYAGQPLLNQLYVLWASAKIADLLNASERKALVETVAGLQETDGGWRTGSLDKWVRSDKTVAGKESDAFATALVVLTMEESGGGLSAESMKRGVGWLEQHQGPQGDWRAASLNKKRDPESNVGRFMSDAATGYAVLALERAGRR